ncbi:MAG: glycosyltransferase [Rhodospirillales bacterium]|nr:glycosyltransferase [Rhodospirillales bacterium]
MTVSVIIPTLNEHDNLTRLLTELGGEANETDEIIVVDGGSTDGTIDIAEQAACRLLTAPRGRGQQLARGANDATGEILFFLHADCRLPAGGLGEIRKRITADPDIVGGNFRLLFDGDTKFDRWLNGFYAWNRRRGIYYGDSGIFVRRDAYQRLGGIKPIALMEDYDFVRRMERAGKTICIEHPPLVTSSRRFLGRRPPAIVLGWLKIHALYHLGVTPDRLARIYDRGRH